VVLLVPVTIFIVGMTWRDAHRACDLNMQMRLYDLMREHLRSEPEKLALFDKAVGSTGHDGPIALYNHTVTTIVSNNIENVLAQVMTESKTTALCNGTVQSSLIDSAKVIGALVLALIAAYFGLVALVKTFGWVRHGFRH